MGERARGMYTLLGMVLVAAIAYLGAREWQSGELDYARVEGPAGCDLRAGPCRQAVDRGSIALSIAPNTIPLMQSLTLEVETQGLVADQVEVEIRGLNMDMGLNRTRLSAGGDGRWRGETILPVCSQRRMEWEAAVRVIAERPVEVAFAFHTTRP